ncbi:MAG: glycosyltransferase family 39 protein [Chloroflexi bacterium]|nr:glycosyltransferase family 39 protein [Chloroflexota bacterium]
MGVPRPQALRYRALSLGFVRSAGFWLAAVVFAGVALRLAWTQWQDFFPLGGDGRWYLTVARNVAEGRGYVIAFDEHGRELVGQGQPTAFWPPGYPFALAGAFKLFGPGMTAVELLNVAAEAASIVLIFLLGRRVAGTATGLLAAGLYALLPEPVLASQFAISEFVFTALFLGALGLLVLAPWPQFRAAPPLLFGLLAGLAVLTRGEAIILLPAAALFWVQREGWRSAARALGLASLGLVIAVAPWAARNAIVLDAFVPVSTNVGFNLRVGHAPGADGTFFWPDKIEEDDTNTQFEAAQPAQEVERNRIYTRRALGYMVTHPSDELALAGKKLSWLFRADAGLVDGLELMGSPVRPAPLAAALPVAVIVSYYALLALATLALPFWLRRRDPAATLLVSLVALWALFHVGFFSLPRYHLPLLPLFAIAAAWLITGLAGALRGRAEAAAAN